eukprot:scaffold5.g875.t1
MAALRARGLTVQSFKVGPDFIDPMHHEQATGRPSINLDAWMLSREQVLASFHRAVEGADVAVVEGVMGLFDGMDGQSEQGSTAQLAKWLGAPVLLVLDCSAVARSAAAVVKGYLEFDPELQLGGLLFNKVGGEAHTQWLKDAIASGGITLPVLGGIPQARARALEAVASKEVAMPERHHGLHMPGEDSIPPDLVASLAELVGTHVDLDALLEVAATARVPPAPATAVGEDETGAPPPPLAAEGSAESADSGAGGAPRVRIAVARDAAFCFYYHDSLALLRAAGAELVPFSPLADGGLPRGVSGVYLGGGYPERHARVLAANGAVRASLRGFATAGGVVYAECGGLVYLSQSIVLPGEAPCPMAGVFSFKTVLSGKMAMGYCEVETTGACPLFPPGRRVRGQVFHFSEIVQESVVGGAGAALSSSPRPDKASGASSDASWQHGYLTRAKIPGAAEVPEGFCRDNVLASYVHLHFGGCPDLAAALVERCRSVDAAAAGEAAAAAAAAAALECQAAAPATQPLGSAGSNGYPPHPPPSPTISPVHSRLGRPATSMGLANGGGAHGSSGGGGGGLFASHSSPNLAHDERALLAQQQAQQLRAAGMMRAATSLDLGMANGLQRHPSMVPLSGRTSSGQIPLSGRTSSGQIPLLQLHKAGSSCSLAALHGGGFDAGAPSQPTSQQGTMPPSVSESPMAQSPRESLLPHGQPAFAHGSAYPPGHPAGHLPLHGYPSAYQQQHHPYAHPYAHLVHAHTHNPLWEAGDGGGLHGGGFAPYSQQPLHGVAPLGAGGAYHLGGPSRNNSTGHLPSPRSWSSLQQAAAYAGHAAAAPPHYAPPPLHPALPLASAVADYWPPPQPPLVRGPHSRSGSLDKPSGALPPLPHGGENAPPYAQLQQHLFLAAPRLQRPPSPLSARALPLGGGPSFSWALAGQQPSDKIVSLSPGATEMLWVLGLGNRVVATTDACDYPPQAAARAKARHSFGGGEGGGGPPSLSGGGSLHGTSTPGGSSASTTDSPSYVGDTGHSSRLRWDETAIDEQARREAGREGGATWHQAVCRVLARERPGLIVCEEEPEGGPLGSAWSTSSSLSSGSGGWEGGGVVRAVLSALVAVGLQHSCRVVCVRRRTLSDVLDSMLAVGEAAGVAEEAARTVDRLRTRLRRLTAAAAQAAAAAPRRPCVLVLQSLAPLRTVGWWAGDMIALAGGMDVAAEGAGDPPRELTWKEVQAFAPDVLVVTGMQGGSAARPLADLCGLAGRPGWWLLPAVKASEVYVVDAALFCRAGPRLVEGVEALAHMLQPEEGVLTASCPERGVLKLSLRPGQRCRQRLLPNHFVVFT